MFLQKLELAGFKSFAKKTTLTFTRGITAIVGPNGSGKSNVADAIRWVMGEQSLKLLRGKRGEDVIFAGSDKKTRLGLAEVALSLNNEDEQAPVDYTEVEILRRIDRDGRGEYLLNRAQVRLQDIQLFLAKCTIGQQTYSVIGQGMVDSFLSSSPSERKELFDDAAGVRQFQIKREQALLKLQHAKENLRQAAVLLEEIAPRLRSLTRAVRRLERRGEVEQELRQFQTALYGRRLQRLQKQLEELHTSHEQRARERTAAEQEVGAIQRELESIERSESREERFVDLQKQYNAVLDEKNALVREQSVLKGQLEVQAAQQGSIDRVLTEQRVEELGVQLRRFAEERATLAQALASDEERERNEEQELARAVAQLRLLGEKLQATHAALRGAARLDPRKLEEEVRGLMGLHDRVVEALKALGTPDSPPTRGGVWGGGSLLRLAARVHDGFLALLKKLEKGGSFEPAETLMALQEEQGSLLAHKDQLTGSLHERRVKLERKRTRLQLLQEQQDAKTGERERLEARLERLQEEPRSGEAGYRQYLEEKRRLDTSIAAQDKKLAEIRECITALSREEEAKKGRLFDLQKRFRDAQAALTVAAEHVGSVNVDMAKAQTHRDDLEKEMRRDLPQTVVDDVFTTIQKGTVAKEREDEELETEIAQLKHTLDLIGGIEEGTVEEYQTTKERHDFLDTQSKDLTKGIADLERAIEELNVTIKKQFQSAFAAIDEKFRLYFRTLFSGGMAKLVLVKEAPQETLPAEAEGEETAETEAAPEGVKAPQEKQEKIVTGVEIQATPPGKKLKNIAMLSGGERALTSIALLCAIIASNPSPFVVLDEVDAALDEANSQRFAAILGQLAAKTQFIVITHNRATMEKAHTLYGVTMGDDGVSKLLSVKMEQAEKVIQTHGNR